MFERIKSLLQPPSRGRTSLEDYSILGVDMHAHLLPGVDDGADTLETALRLIGELQALGFRQLAATPHVMADFYPNTREDILAKFETLKNAAAAAYPGLQLVCGAEYMMDDHFEELLASDDFIPMPGNYLLVEMSFFSPPPQLSEFIFRLRTKKYKPILAHPERYVYFKSDFGKFERLKEMGCRFQTNIRSLLGAYGPEVTRLAEKLLRNGMIDFLGTDLHNQHHIEELKEGLKSKSLARVLGSYTFANGSLG